MILKSVEQFSGSDGDVALLIKLEPDGPGAVYPPDAPTAGFEAHAFAGPVDVSDAAAPQADAKAVGPALQILIPILVNALLAFLKGRGLLTGVLVLASLAATAGDAAACGRRPVRQFLSNVFGGRGQCAPAQSSYPSGGCAGGSCAPAGATYQYQPVTLPYGVSPFGNCPGGVCPAPAKR